MLKETIYSRSPWQAHSQPQFFCGAREFFLEGGGQLMIQVPRGYIPAPGMLNEASLMSLFCLCCRPVRLTALIHRAPEEG